MRVLEEGDEIELSVHVISLFLRLLHLFLHLGQFHFFSGRILAEVAEAGVNVVATPVWILQKRSALRLVVLLCPVQVMLAG